MHELGVCTAIVDALERRANGRSVAAVRVRVGCLHHFHPDAFAQSFALAAEGSVAAGAVPELVVLPVAARCWRCGATFEAADHVLACERCGSPEVEERGGDELVLERIEYRA